MVRKLVNYSREHKLRRAWAFLADDVWDVELSTLSGLRRFGVQAVRIVQLVFKGFKDDECPLHASALTFNTMMAIVPILALSLAVARGFDGDEAAKNWVQIRVSEWTQQFERSEAPSKIPVSVEASTGSEQSDVAGVVLPASTNALPPVSTVSSVSEGITPEELASQINSLVEKTFEKMDAISFKALGGVGLGLLLWMVISALGRVEASFNRVWGVSAQRPLWRKFTDYLSILLVFPILLIAASSLPIVDYATRYLDDSSADYVRRVLLSGTLKNFAVLSLTCLSFSFLLMFMPNTRVMARPGLVGGCVTGLLFLLWLWACASIQIGVANMGRIYGTFAVLPILLIWVNMSWQLVFFGAEVAFAVQNCSTYRMEQGARRANVRAKLTLALTLVIEAAKSMDGSRPHLNVADFTRQYRAPVRFINEVIQELVEARVLAQLSDADESYVLLRSPEFVKVTEIMDVVLGTGVDPESLGLERIDVLVRKLIKDAHDKMFESLEGLTIGELSARASGTLQV